MFNYHWLRAGFGSPNAYELDQAEHPSVWDYELTVSMFWDRVNLVFCFFWDPLLSNPNFDYRGYPCICIILRVRLPLVYASRLLIACKLCRTNVKLLWRRVQ